MWFMNIVIFCILYTHKVDDQIGRSQESQARHLQQVVITNSKASSEDRVGLGKIFKLNSVYISKLIVNNGRHSGTKPEKFNVCQNMLLASHPDELCAGEKLDAHNLTGKSLGYPE